MIASPKLGLNTMMDIVYPSSCYVCLKETSTWGLCYKCYKKINYLGVDVCAMCGYPLESIDSSEFFLESEKVEKNLCYRCQQHRLYLNESRSVCAYDQFTKSFVLSLKYGASFYYVPYLGNMMIAALPKDWHIDTITSVPLSLLRKFYRGYNQSALLARYISHRLGYSYRPFLRRVWWYTHSEKHRLRRFYSQEKSLYLKKTSYTQHLRGKNVLLVDDVMTTGATLSMCAKVLKNNGANKVYGLTALRVIL